MLMLPLCVWCQLQANWMWPPPADLPGQGADLYHAVRADTQDCVSSRSGGH